MTARFRIAARLARDAWREAITYRDWGAARTALSGAWAALKGAFS